MYRVQFRRYRLPFRGPVRTAHGLWADREGLIVRVEDEQGGVGFGEAAPVPGFGRETVDDDEAAVRALGDAPTEELLAALPRELGCVHHALAAAKSQLAPTSAATTDSEKEPTYLAVAALLPAGRAALELISPRAEIGFRVFKWKVGVGDSADELALLDDVCAALPAGAKLRLDANGAWDRRQAERWLERCADRPIDFIEQPSFARASEGTALRRRVEDMLLGLAADYPTPLALDESLVGEGDIDRWLGAGWPGVYVLKLALIGDVAASLEKLHRAKASVVFSSALETAIGARTALRHAFAWPGERRALGFGVWPLFADARFDGPALAPFVRVEDLERLDPKIVWHALT